MCQLVPFPSPRLVRSLLALFVGLGAAHAQEEASASKRLPVPDLEVLQAVEAEIQKEAFPGLTQDREGKEAAQYAAKLLSVASGTDDRPEVRYALLHHAVRVSAYGGQMELLERAVAALAEGYEVDRLTLELEHFSVFADESVGPPKRRPAILRLVRIAEAAQAMDRRDVQDAVFEVVSDALKRLPGTELGAELKKVEDALAALSEDDGDESAHEVLGRYHSTVDVDWPMAMQHLASLTDSPLGDAARGEVEGVSQLDSQLALADRWWELAQDGKQDAGLRAVWRERAQHWYRIVRQDLKGYEAERVGRRLSSGSRRQKGDRAVEAFVIPPHVDVNIAALREHRPRYAECVEAELDAVVAAAARGNPEQFREAVCAAIEATHASERPRERRGCQNCREDILKVLHELQAGRWDLRKLKFHVADHRKRRMRDGLPGLLYERK